MRSAQRVSTAAALAAAGILLAAAPASAHAALVGMTPTVGSTVVTAPTEVDLTFDEALSTTPATITVTAPDGTDVTAGPPRIDGTELHVPLKPLTAAGGYSVSYRVVPTDGQPVSDQLHFTLTDEDTTPATVSVGGDDIQSNWWATHYIHFGLGVMVFSVIAWLMFVLTKPPRPRKTDA